MCCLAGDHTKVGVAKGQLFRGPDQRGYGVAGGERLLDHETTGATGGSQDYQVHWICSFRTNVSKLKLQVANLEELEASTYSRAGFRPAAETAPVVEQPRVERLASFDGHLHPVAGCDRFPVAARSRDDSLRVRRHRCTVQSTAP